MKRLKELINRIQKFGQLCKSNHLDSHSAAAAFFMFLSVIPFFMLLLSIVPYTPITDNEIVRFLELLLPETLDSLAVDIMNQVTNESLTLLSVSAITSIWTAARSVQTIKQGLNEIHGITLMKNFVILRADSAFYTLILLVSLMLILFLNVIVTGIERYLKAVVGISILEQFSMFEAIYRVRPLVTIGLGFLLTIYFYTFLPSKKIKVRSQIPGAVIVSIGWFLFTSVFSIYIKKFNAYSMYGSFAIIVIALMWIYACMYMLFCGAQLNYYLSIQSENNTI